MATPRVGEQEDRDSPTKKRKFLNKKQIIDSVTELEDGPGMNFGGQGKRGGLDGGVEFG